MKEFWLMEEVWEVSLFSFKKIVFSIFPREICLFYLLPLEGSPKMVIYVFLNKNSAIYLMSLKLEVYGVCRYAG